MILDAIAPFAVAYRPWFSIYAATMALALGFLS